MGNLVVGRRGEEIQSTSERVVGSDLRVDPVAEEKAAVLARHDLPPGVGVVGAGDTGKEDIGTADGGGEVGVGAAAEGREVGDLGAIGVEEEAEERGGCTARKWRRKAGEERTATRKALQVRVARTRDRSEGSGGRSGAEGRRRVRK
jgi:hypothetical protein